MTVSEGGGAMKFSENCDDEMPKTSAGLNYITFGRGKRKFVIIPGLSIHSVIGLKDAVINAYQAFAEDYTVYLFDRPKVLNDGITVRKLAEQTAAAMQELGIDGAYVLGVSQGGMIAQYIAIDYPELISKMVLGSTLSRPNAVFERLVNKWISLAKQRDERALIEGFVEAVYSKKTLDAYKDMLISSNLGITEDEYKRFCRLASSCLSFNCCNELSMIKCPVLVIGAEGDKVVTAEAARETAEALGCELYIYDESFGHGVYDEAADYKQRCLEFFA